MENVKVWVCYCWVLPMTEKQWEPGKIVWYRFDIHHPSILCDALNDSKKNTVDFIHNELQRLKILREWLIIRWPLHFLSWAQILNVTQSFVRWSCWIFKKYHRFLHVFAYHLFNLLWSNVVVLLVPFYFTSLSRTLLLVHQHDNWIKTVAFLTCVYC